MSFLALFFTDGFMGNPVQHGRGIKTEGVAMFVSPESFSLYLSLLCTSFVTVSQV